MSGLVSSEIVCLMSDFFIFEGFFTFDNEVNQTIACIKQQVDCNSALLVFKSKIIYPSILL